MSKDGQKKDFILKHGAIIDKKFIKAGAKVSLTQGEFKALEGTATAKDLIPVEETKTK